MGLDVIGGTDRIEMKSTFNTQSVVALLLEIDNIHLCLRSALIRYLCQAVDLKIPYSFPQVQKG